MSIKSDTVDPMQLHTGAIIAKGQVVSLENYRPFEQRDSTLHSTWDKKPRVSHSCPAAGQTLTPRRRAHTLVSTLVSTPGRKCRVMMTNL